MKKNRHQSGQTLVIMLVITGFVLVILSAVLVMSLTSSASTLSTTNATAAQYWAEAGLETGLMRFLRDPSYRGETVTNNTYTTTISITGSGPYTISSSAQAGTSRKQVTATIQFTNGVMSVTAWQDVY